MDLVAVLCGHLNRLHAQRERDGALQDLRCVVTTGFVWVHQHSEWDGQRRVRGQYKLSISDTRTGYLVHRIIGQLQRRVLTSSDVVDATVLAAQQVVPLTFTRECAWCNTHVKEHIEGWKDCWKHRWPADDVLETTLTHLRSLTEDPNRHAADCPYHHPPPLHNGVWYILRKVVACGRILVTHGQGGGTEEGSIWIPLSNNKDPLGCATVAFQNT